MIFANIASVFHLSWDDIYALPKSRFNTLYEQSFNQVNLQSGNGGYEVQTIRDKEAQTKAEYEAIKKMNF